MPHLLVILHSADLRQSAQRLTDLLRKLPVAAVVLLPDQPGTLTPQSTDWALYLNGPRLLPLPYPASPAAAAGNLTLLRDVARTIGAQALTGTERAVAAAPSLFGTPLDQAVPDLAWSLLEWGGAAAPARPPVGPRSLPEAVLESPAPGQFLDADEAVVRGWVDQLPVHVEAVVVEASGLRLELPVGMPRPDIIQRRRSHRVQGFEGRIPLLDQPCRTELRLSLRFDGGVQLWQTLDIWHPRMQVAVPLRPLLRVAWSYDADRLRFQTDPPGQHGLLIVWQDGAAVASGALDAGGACGMTLSGYEPVNDAFLWLHPKTAEPIFLDRLAGNGPMGHEVQRTGLRSLGNSSPDNKGGGAARVLVNGQFMNGETTAGAWLMTTTGLPETLWVQVGDPPGKSSVFLAQDLRLFSALRHCAMEGRMLLLEVDGAPMLPFQAAAVQPTAAGFCLLGLWAGRLPAMAIEAWRIGKVVALEDRQPLAGAERDAVEALRRQAAGVPPLPPSRTLVLPARCDAALPPVRQRCVLLRQDHAPTDDLYVTSAMEILVRERGWRQRAIDLHSGAALADPDSLQDGDLVVVSRYVSEPWFQRLAAMRDRLRIVYLIDDDVTAAIDTPALPAVYRRRMDDVALVDFQAMLRLCHHLVVTSAQLARTFASPKTALLHPPCLRWPKSLAHHEEAGPVRVVYHGTDAHREDIRFLSSVLEELARKFGRAVEVEIFSSFAWPVTLANLRFIKPKPWQDYVAHVAAHPAHVAVVPLLATPYNAGKSIIKMHDTTALGAAGIYSMVDPYRDVVRNGEDGLLVANDPGLWMQALKLLVEQKALRQGLAKAALARAEAEFTQAHTTTFWKELLDLP